MRKGKHHCPSSCQQVPGRVGWGAAYVSQPVLQHRTTQQSCPGSLIPLASLTPWEGAAGRTPHPAPSPTGLWTVPLVSYPHLPTGFIPWEHSPHARAVAQKVKQELSLPCSSFTARYTAQPKAPSHGAPLCQQQPDRPPSLQHRWAPAQLPRVRTVQQHGAATLICPHMALPELIGFQQQVDFSGL